MKKVFINEYKIFGLWICLFCQIQLQAKLSFVGYSQIEKNSDCGRLLTVAMKQWSSPSAWNAVTDYFLEVDDEGLFTRGGFMSHLLSARSEKGAARRRYLRDARKILDNKNSEGIPFRQLWVHPDISEARFDRYGQVSSGKISEPKASTQNLRHLFMEAHPRLTQLTIEKFRQVGHPADLNSPRDLEEADVNQYARILRAPQFSLSGAEVREFLHLHPWGGSLEGPRFSTQKGKYAIEMLVSRTIDGLGETRKNTLNFSLYFYYEGQAYGYNTGSLGVGIRHRTGRLLSLGMYEPGRRVGGYFDIPEADLPSHDDWTLHIVVW